MAIPSKEGRARIETAGGRMNISIPAKKNFFMLLFLCFWLSAWYSAEISAINDVFVKQRNTTFMGFWLAGWTVGGIWAILTLCWMLLGSETVTIGQGFVSVQRSILGLGPSREYPLSAVTNLRITPQEITDTWLNRQFGLKYFGWATGPIAYDYGMKTVKFGLGIDEDEANHILTLLHEKGFPMGYKGKDSDE